MSQEHIGEPHQIFMDIIQERGGVEEILEAMAGFLENTAFWDTSTGNIHIASRSEQFIAQMRRMPLHELVAIYPHGTVEDGGERLGYMFYYHEGDGLSQESRDLALKFGLTALKFSLGGRRYLLKEDRRIREELVRGVLAGNKRLAEKNIKKAAMAGWHLPESAVVTVAEFRGNGDPSGPIEILGGWLRSRYPQGIQATIADDLVALIPCQEGEWALRLKEALSEYTTSSHSKYPFRIGIGSPASNPMEYRKSHEEARAAIEIAQRLTEGDVVFWRDMETLDLLSSIPWNERTKAFVKKYLGDLDREGELASSLRALVKYGWNMKCAASALSIHYNTMRYRYDKIGSVINMEDDPWMRLNITLAVILDELAEKMRRK